MDSGRDHWPKLATVYSGVGPPLRPCEEDMSIVWNAVRAKHARREAAVDRAFRVLVMGATEEYYHLPWPTGSRIIAVDHNAEALRRMWPGPPDSTAVCDWRRLDFPDASVDVVLCDGGLGLVDAPAGLSEVAGEVARVLAPGGLFVARLFVPPSEQESVGSVLDEFAAGLIPDVNRLKMRLWFALQDRIDWSVAVAEVWNVMADGERRVSEAAHRLGWAEEWMRTVEPYRDSDIRYYLPPTDDVVTLVRSAVPDLRLHSVTTPGYDTGVLCPTVVLRCDGAGR